MFTYLHLAASKELTESLLASGCTAIAYETIEVNGRLPLLEPMSEIAGRMSVIVGAYHLAKHRGGRGILLGGVPGVLPGKVVVIGGGTAGVNAARVATGVGADVTILEVDLERMRFLDITMQTAHTLYSSADSLMQQLPRVDLIVGAVLVPGAKAPKLINAEIETRVTEARAVSDPAFMDTRVTPNPIPGLPGTETQRFNETRAREVISAEYAPERARLEAETQGALNMAALVDPVNGLEEMRAVADAALAATDLPDAAREAVLETGAFSEEGYHRADAFQRAADAWAEGSGDMASHPLDPEATTAAYAAANPMNPYVAANLDDILGRLSNQPELAADMRLYAATQLGDAIYNAETGARIALINQIEAGHATSAQAQALQTEIAATQPGREALRQLQVLFSPADLANQASRTGEMQNRGVLNFRPGTAENPMGGYPEVIRNTIGAGIDAAMDTRGWAGAITAASVFLPGPEDFAIATGGRLIGGRLFGNLFRGLRIGDEAVEAAADALGPVRRQITDTPPLIPDADIPPIPDAPVARLDGLQPGTAEHKLNRWQHHATTRENPWSYERWSANYDKLITATADAARRAEDYVAETGFGVPNTTVFSVEVGGRTVARVPDVIDEVLEQSRELKSGYQSLTTANRQQIAADVALRGRFEPTWVFDIRDGARSPSQPLLDALDEANIPYEILRP